MAIGDTLPSLTITATNNGGLYDLTGATATLFVRAESATANKFSRVGTLTSATAGIITFTWQASDWDVAGTYYGELEIDFTGGNTDAAPEARIEITVLTTYRSGP